MSENQISLFDYAGLPSLEAVEIRAAAERIKVRLKRTAEDIIEIGRDLIAVKTQLGHGSFEGWLNSEFGFSQMQASRFMNVAEKFGDSKSNIMLDFKPTILYALAAPSMPESVRAEVIERAEAGEKITLAEVEQLKREAAQALDLKQRNTDLHKTIMELARQSDALKAELDARPEPAVIEKVVEKTVEVLPGDYESLQRKAAKLGELKDDLAAANEALAKLKAEQARKVEDGIRQGLRQRQAEIDEIERRKAELERMIETRVKTLNDFDTVKNESQVIIEALQAFHQNSVSNAGGLSATLLSVEVSALYPSAHDALDRFICELSHARYMLDEAESIAKRLKALPVATIEKEAT